MAKIYISSTYEDLSEHRNVVARMVRKLGHTPVFWGEDKSSSLRVLEKRLREVRQCDMFIGMYAWRYGVIPSGSMKSFQHMEYEEALRNYIPCLILLLHESAAWPTKWVAVGREWKYVEDFRALLSQNSQTNFFFSDNRELQKTVVASIEKVIQPDNEKNDSLTFWKKVYYRILPIFFLIIGISLISAGILTHYLGKESEPEGGTGAPIQNNGTIFLDGISFKKTTNSDGFWEIDIGYGNRVIGIPQGDFNMGEKNNFVDQLPVRNLYLDVYWIGKTEVTIGQFRQFAGETGSHYPIWQEQGSELNIETGNNDLYKKMGTALTNPSNPIIGISWDDALAYCRWLSNKTKLNVTLPTEAQWEKAARGTDGYKYPWSNGKVTGKHANIADEEFFKEFPYLWVDKSINDGYTYTAPAGSFPDGASPYGALDMAGNVWEWCLDWYANGYDEAANENPKGPEKGEYRVMRGGSWSYYNGRCNCAYRNCECPSRRTPDIGFRIVINPEKWRIANHF